MEPAQTLAELRRCFPNARVVPALPGGAALRDEGAANHMRLGSAADSPGLHLFVYGDEAPPPANFWPRQSRQACQTIARCHRLPAENTYFLKQHPDAIDAGAFHNDVVAASHHHLLIFHQQAFYQPEATLKQICDRYAQRYRRPLCLLPVDERTLPLSRAVSTYLFNSQIVSVAGVESPVMLCPAQVKQDSDARGLVEAWLADDIFSDIHYVDLQQSMSGGGGPACLRLRVPMTTADAAKLDPRFLWSEQLDEQLRRVIHQHYPTRLTLAELTEVEFIREAENTTQRLRNLLG
jgi:succinylarginine dihydrolase